MAPRLRSSGQLDSYVSASRGQLCQATRSDRFSASACRRIVGEIAEAGAFGDKRPVDTINI